MIKLPHLEEAMKEYPGDQWKNLYEETLCSIAESNHTTNDIAWIGIRSSDYAINWEEYRQISDITYYSGFGGTNIPDDLIVVFDDGSWLERDEYDGNEWWKCVTPPQQPPTPKKFTLTVNQEKSVIGPRYEIDDQLEHGTAHE